MTVAWISTASESRPAAAAAPRTIAEARGQSLAQLAITWALRDERVTSVLLGASSVAQLTENLAALDAPDLSAEEMAAIEPHAVDTGINLWASRSSDL